MLCFHSTTGTYSSNRCWWRSTETWVKTGHFRLKIKTKKRLISVTGKRIDVNWSNKDDDDDDDGDYDYGDGVDGNDHDDVDDDDDDEDDDDIVVLLKQVPYCF